MSAFGVTRVFNDETFFVRPDRQIELQTGLPLSDFALFINKKACCAQSLDLQDKNIQDLRVWINFSGQNVEIHGPLCILPHSNTPQVIAVPKRWKNFQNNPYPSPAIEPYEHNQALEESKIQTIETLVDQAKWKLAYRDFFELLPSIGLETTIATIASLAEKITPVEGDEKTVKATIAMGLFWLGLNTQNERAELAKKSYKAGLKILQDIGIEQTYPAMPLRVRAHLVELLKNESEEEIRVRTDIVKLLDPLDDAMKPQLERLVQLQPTVLPTPLKRCSNKMLIWLAESYRDEGQNELEIKARYKYLKNLLERENPLEDAIKFQLKRLVQLQPAVLPIALERCTHNMLLWLTQSYQKSEQTDLEIQVRIEHLNRLVKSSATDAVIQSELKRLIQLQPTVLPIEVEYLSNETLPWLAEIYQEIEQTDLEIQVRREYLNKLVKLNPLDTAIQPQLERLVELQPTVLPIALERLSNELLLCLAQNYRNHWQTDLEVKARLKYLTRIDDPNYAIRIQELNRILERVPDFDPYRVYTSALPPDQVLSHIADILQKQGKREEAIKIRVNRLRVFHSATSESLLGEILRIAQADPKYNFYSIFPAVLSKKALACLANLYDELGNTEAQIKALCKIIHHYTLKKTPNNALDSLFELDFQGNWYNQMSDTKEQRLSLAMSFMQQYANVNEWSKAHTLAKRTFKEHPNDVPLAEKLLEYAIELPNLPIEEHCDDDHLIKIFQEYATQGKTIEDDIIDAHKQLIRIKQNKETVDAFLTFCKKKPNELADSAYQILIQLPELTPENLPTLEQYKAAVKLLKCVYPKDALALASETIKTHPSDIKAIKLYYEALVGDKKEQDAIKLLSDKINESSKQCQWELYLELLKFAEENELNSKEFISIEHVEPLIQDFHAFKETQAEKTAELEQRLKNLEEALEKSKGAPLRSGSPGTWGSFSIPLPFMSSSSED